MLANMISGEDTYFTTVCREQGWKRTVQRRAVWDYLCGNREHPSVEMVWRRVKDRLPDVSLDSIYRILDDFAEVGIIRRLDGAKVVRYDSDTAPHEHFICIECGRIYDFAYVDQDSILSLCNSFGVVHKMEVTVRGTCKTCLDSRNSLAGYRHRV